MTREVPMLRSSMIAAVLMAASVPLGAQQRERTYTPGALTANQQLARDIYKQLIEINTAVTTGNVTTAAVAMAQRFRDAGIPDSDIFVGGPRAEKHNVVARIRGREGSTRRPILLLAHLDVVEALKADWSPDLDPYVFLERDGYYYGRGTADDKAMAAIFVANVARMKQDGFVPDRDIIIALTADEEGGDANGVEWLLKNHRDHVDAALVINEGGGGVLRNGRPLFLTVQATEKIFANVIVRATNRGGHSSVPRADNAITSLATALTRIARYNFPVQLNEVTREFFTKTALVEGPSMAQAMRALVANPRNRDALLVVSSEPRYNAMLRTTCVATMLKGGHAENALPQLAEANVNCRMYPGTTAEQTRDALARVVNDSTVQLVVDFAARPPEPPTPLLPEVMEPVNRITREMFGAIPVIPTMSTGATDSRYFRQLNIPAFGVSGLFSDPTVDARAHGRDERMRVQSFYEGQEFLYRLTKALAQPPTATP
jgi:acetylornithine deacetylase/succinyl-diaminopimelate desuccinylase-like protein